MRIPLLIALVAALALAFAPWDVLAQDEKPGGRDPAVRDLDAYRLRVGDLVSFVVYDHSELNQKYRIAANGQISFSPVGKINLLGRTTFEVEETIQQRLKDENFLVDPRVACIVEAYAPRKVYVLGAVTRTVELPIQRNMRILELLAETGGLGSDVADFARVHIRRLSPEGRPYKVNVNVNEVLHGVREDRNVVVFEGDIVWVPTLSGSNPLASDFVYVLGKVGAPGRHPIVIGPTPFTITKLIAMVGDFQEFADRSKVRIIRRGPTGSVPTVLDFDDIIEGNRADFELQPDDLIYVPETWI